MSVFDKPRPGAPKMATMEDNMKKIHNLLLADRWLNGHEIAETIGISKDRVGHILHEILGMRKLSGAAFAHSGQQGQPWDHFRAVFDAV